MSSTPASQGSQASPGIVANLDTADQGIASRVTVVRGTVVRGTVARGTPEAVRTAATAGNRLAVGPDIASCTAPSALESSNARLSRHSH